MATYTQADRPMRVLSTLPDDDLLLVGFNGEEAVSAPGGFTVDLLSLRPDLEARDLLRQPMGIAIDLMDGSTRYLQGRVRRFTHMGAYYDLSVYQAEIVPWLWFLSLSSDCRIFQNLTALDIVEQVFKDCGFVDFEVRCLKSYPKREFCVQYHESHFHFVSRLLEDEGIFYFFEHDANKHTLVLADHSSKVVDCPGQSSVPLAAPTTGAVPLDVIHGVQQEDQVATGTVTYRDFNPFDPRTNLTSTLRGTSAEEFYEFPGGHMTLDEGERFARLTLEEFEAAHRLVYGNGTARSLTAGHKFKLAGHPRADLNTDWALLRVVHSGRNGDYRASRTLEFDYHNTFVGLPHAVVYRPPSLTPRPRVRGIQTAIVTGAHGEEIWPDEHGRIKVKFHWDRYGADDETSSCWIRVAQPWAGRSWGMLSLPRIGQEVVVDFLEGDPDQPLVIGSVYNGQQPPPFGLPGGKNTSGVKSNSTKGGGGYNQFSMDDTKGKEAVTIHAQKDMSTTVEHDKSNTVHNDESLTVTKGNRTIKVQTGKHTEEIKGDTSITILTGNHKLDVQTGTHTHHVKADVVENYDANQNTTVKKTITINGGDSILLKSGNSSIELLKDGTITVRGKNINVIATDGIKESGDTVEVTGSKTAKFGVSNQQVTCDTQKVNVSGAAINSSAVGMHELTGALVKIN